MKKTISISKLVVNPENYRFDPVDNEEEAIDLMIEEKGPEILNLATHILENGLDEAKDLRVLKLDTRDEYLVLDGNRRITALKCLHKPALVKDKKLRDGFHKLLKSGKKPVESIQCFVYPDQKAAANWIKLDHTGKNDGVGQDSWGSAEKDRFGYEFEGKISPALQAVHLVEKKLNKKINTKKLKISTINRILSNPASRSFLGVDIEKGKLLFTCNIKEAIERMDALFNKVISEDVTVGTVYSTGQSLEFVKKLYGSKPATTEKQTLPSFADEDEKHPTEKKSEPGTVAKKDWITDAEYKAYEGAGKVKHLLNEMKQIEPTDMPNILMPSLRVLLELALYYKLEEKKHIAKMVINYKAEKKAENADRTKLGKAIVEPKKNWSPNFREMLDYIIIEGNNAIIDPQMRKTLEKKIKSEGNFIASLNDFIHNVHDIPSKDDPEKTWRQFGRLLFEIIGRIT